MNFEISNFANFEFTNFSKNLHQILCYMAQSGVPTLLLLVSVEKEKKIRERKRKERRKGKKKRVSRGERGEGSEV